MKYLGLYATTTGDMHDGVHDRKRLERKCPPSSVTSSHVNVTQTLNDDLSLFLAGKLLFFVNRNRLSFTDFLFSDCHSYSN